MKELIGISISLVSLAVVGSTFAVVLIREKQVVQGIKAESPRMILKKLLYK